MLAAEVIAVARALAYTREATPLQP